MPFFSRFFSSLIFPALSFIFSLSFFSLIRRKVLKRPPLGETQFQICCIFLLITGRMFQLVCCKRCKRFSCFALTIQNHFTSVDSSLVQEKRRSNKNPWSPQVLSLRFVVLLSPNSCFKQSGADWVQRCQERLRDLSKVEVT